MPSGSATGAFGCVRARVAVRPVRSGSSGSATGTFSAEWQCDRCARVRSVPSGSAGHTAKWRRACRNGTLGAEWQCDSHCHSSVNVRGLSVQARVAVRQARSGPSGSASGTLRVEWQCDRYARVRSGPSGSAGHTAKWRRAYRCGTLRVEWQCDRYVRARVAVRITLPLAGERAGVERSVPSGSATGMLRGSLAAHAGVCSRS